MMPSYANPNMRGGNDPNRSAVMSVFGRPGASPQGPAPAQGAGTPAPSSVGEHLAMAYQAFIQGGANEADKEQILQFVQAIQALGSAPSPQTQGPSVPPNYGAVPAQAAQGAPQFRGPMR